jgi:hypothetical protein
MEQLIPTHQIVKFDGAIQALCQDCWEGFRAWFFAAERIVRFDPAMIPTTTEPSPDNSRAA